MVSQNPPSKRRTVRKSSESKKISINNSSLKRNLIILKLLKPDVLAFTGTIFVVYQLKIIGLTLGQVMLAQSVAAATILLCEVPSGVISDLINRKLTFVIAECFYLGSILTFAFAQNFTHIIIMEILFGIAYATLSGTDSALLYDTLKDLKREDEFAKYQGHYISFFLVAITIANVAAGFVAEIDLKIPIMACIPIPAIQLGLALFLAEPSKPNRRSGQAPLQKNSMRHVLKSFKGLIGHRVLFYIVLLGIFIAIGRKAVLHTFNPFMELIEMPLKFWGILLAAFNLTAALASKHAHTLLRILGMRKSVFLTLALQTLIFILMAKIHLLFAFVFPMLHFVLWPVATVFITAEINDRTDTENRATVLSLSSFAAQLSQIILLPVLGYFADFYSLAHMYLLMAGFCVIFGLVVSFNIIREV